MYNYKQAIKDFIGKDGFVAFEHGFKPRFGMWGITQDEVKGFSGVKFKVDELDDDSARMILRDLLEYENYCKFYA